MKSRMMTSLKQMIIDFSLSQRLSMISFFLILLNALVGLSSGVIGLNLSLWLYEKFHRPELMATAVFFHTAPKIYMSFFAGILTDRFGKDRVLRISVAVFVVTYSSMGVFWFLQLGLERAVVLVFILEGLMGLTAAFYDVALLASVSAFVRPHQYAVTYGFMEICGNSSLLLAPLVGGFLYPFLSLSQLFGISAFCSVILLCFLLLIRFPKSLKKQREVRLNLEAFQFIHCHALLKQSLAYFTSFNICNGLAAGLLSAYVLQRCHGQASGLATFSFSLALGTFCGSFLTLKKTRIEPWHIIIIGGALSAFFGRILLGVSTHLLWVSLFGAIRIGLTPLINTANQVLWSQVTPPEKRARVFGARRLVAQGGYPLSILLGGVLYRIVQKIFPSGLGPFFVIVGILEMTCVGIFLVRELTKKQLQETLPGVSDIPCKTRA